MARVNVEQKALTDSRFEAFGEQLGAPQEFAHATGLGLMIRVWNECQERETKTLTADDLRRITRFENAAVALTNCGLGSHVKGGRIRIHGTCGRIEWLANARKKGRTGGRPKKPYGSEKENPRVLSENNPPAPAPTLKSKAPRSNRGSNVPYADDSREMKAARYLFGKIRANNAEAKEPNWQEWARDFDLIFRLDKRDPADVAKVIDWTQADSFWLTNVLSPAKLRKQYDQLRLKMKPAAAKKLDGPAAAPHHPRFTA